MPITTANSNYRIEGTDIAEQGFVSFDYIIDVYPSLTGILTTAGLWGWGNNSQGQLGTNSLVHRSSPVQTIAGGTNWKQVASNVYHTAGVKTDGSLWLWGHNDTGRLGTNNLTHRSSPVQTVAGGTNWRQVSCGAFHTAAIQDNGRLWVWGLNDEGQLGTNNTTNRSSPVQVVGNALTWSQVSCGTYHTSAIKNDGTLWSWGYNGDGQLGTNNTTSRSSPVQTVAGSGNWKQVSTSTTNTVAIKTDGSLWLWGNNFYGQLGTNNTTDRSSPVQTVAGGTDWKQVSISGNHAAAIKTDGTLWVWGYNGFGQLGTNNLTHRSSPVQTVVGGTNWKRVVAGSAMTAALKNDGTLWVWGYNGNGQLGTNNTTSRSSPVQIGGNNWRSLSLLGDNGSRMFAIRDDSDFPIP